MTNDVRDELTESIVLKCVRVLLSEYIPFDRNILEDIGEKLMSSRKITGEFVTMLMDNFPERTTFESEPRCNSVRVASSVKADYIACEASVQDPDDVVIEQDEHIGILLSHDGHVIYGAEILCLDDDPSDDYISVDNLARVSIDLTYDTSLMLHTLLTHHQRRLIECIFKGSPYSRYKFLGILAEGIQPSFENPDDYMDGEEFQNELEQLVDNLTEVHRVKSDNTLIFVGDSGMIVVSDKWQEYEPLVTFYSLARSSEIFIDALFNRMSLLWDELNKVRQLIDLSSEGDYSVITRAQNILTEASANFTILKSVGGYLTRGFRLILEKWEETADEISREVNELIEVGTAFERLLNRIEDVDIYLESLGSEVDGLSTLLSTQIEQQMRRVYSALRENTRSTSEVIKASERTGDVLDVIELILAGTIAFDIVAALTGEYVTIFHLFPEEQPVLFFVLAVGLWATIAFLLKKSMDWLESKVEKSHMIRIALNRRCDIKSLETYLRTKEIISMDEEQGGDMDRVRVLYSIPEHEGLEEIKATVTYDRRNSMLYDVVIEAYATKKMEIQSRVMNDLERFMLDPQVQYSDESIRKR